MASIYIANNYLSTVETITEKFFSKKDFVRVVARVCLLAWFIDDGLHKTFYWSSNVNFVDENLSCGYFLAAIIVLINIVSVFVASFFILIQKNVLPACCVLACVVAFQTVTMMAVTYATKILLRRCSIMGSLIMLLSESIVEDRYTPPGDITLEDNTRRSFLRLIGRSLLVLVFVSHIQGLRSASETLTLSLAFLEVIASTLMVLVILGYKTRLNALHLVVLLAILNFYRHDWWNAPEKVKPFERYQFFQSWTVAGGLLMVVLLGPGDISVDEVKKSI